MASLVRSAADRLGAVLVFGVAVAGAYVLGRRDDPVGPPGDRRGSGPGWSALGDGRGQRAHTPAQIPGRGWWEVLKRTWQEMQNDRLLLVAAGVVFYALLALVPALSALISVYGLIADPMSVREHLSQIAFMLPEQATTILTEQADRLVTQANTTLSLAFLVSLAIALWSANSGMKALIDGLNIVYEEEEKRSFLQLNAVSLLLTFGAILFVLTAIGAVVVLPGVLKFLRLPGGLEAWISYGRWPLFFIAVVVALAILYRYGPSRERPRFAWVTPGSILAAILWVAGSAILSFYISNFGNYEQTYGSLGAAIGLMVWLWLSAIVVLLGGELNAETEHQTAEDTTAGAEKPLGTRGAAMADRVAPAS